MFWISGLSIYLKVVTMDIQIKRARLTILKQMFQSHYIGIIGIVYLYNGTKEKDPKEL